MPAKLTKAVAYYRMSSDKQEASIPAQRESVTAYAARAGYKILRDYVDEGISGDSTELRAGFLQMRENAASGAFEVVLCWDQDRFGRFDPLEAGHWIQPFRKAGVRLETVGQGRIDWETFAGRLLFMIQQEGKHQYLRDLSRNVLRGHLAGFAKGRWQGGPPFGYDLVDGKLIPNASADIVRLMFDLYSAEGHTLRSLAAHLNSQGILTARGAVWTYAVLRKLLSNRVYIGHYLYGTQSRSKYNHADALSQIVEGPAPKRMILERCDNHEPLVDPDAFARTAHLLSSRKGRKHVRKTDYALAGLLRCGHCGWAMTGKRMVYRGHAAPTYYCNKYMMAGSKTCNRNGVREDMLLPVIVEKISEYWQNASLRQTVEAAARKKARPKCNRGSLPNRAAELDAIIAKGKKRLLTVPDTLYESLLQELQEAEKERSSIEESLREPTHLAFQVDENTAATRAGLLLENLEKSLTQIDAVGIRNSLAGLIKRIELHFTHEQKPKYMRAHFVSGIIKILLVANVLCVSSVQTDDTHETFGLLNFTGDDMLAAAARLGIRKRRKAA